MVNQNEVIDYVIATSVHDPEDNDGADWKQLFYQSQIIYGDKQFSSFVKKLEELALIGRQAKYYINPEHAQQIEEMINGLVMKYIYAIASKSSENGGELLQRLATESKRVDYNMFGGEKGKPESMVNKIKNFDRSKVSQPLRAEQAGIQRAFQP